VPVPAARDQVDMMINRLAAMMAAGDRHASLVS
jgi:hypothetical protein